MRGAAAGGEEYPQPVSKRLGCSSLSLLGRRRREPPDVGTAARQPLGCDALELGQLDRPLPGVRRKAGTVRFGLLPQAVVVHPAVFVPASALIRLAMIQLTARSVLLWSAAEPLADILLNSLTCQAV
jgi:hypothetical protein